MQTSERRIQEQLGTALQHLAALEERAAIEGPGRATQALLKQMRQLITDLDTAFARLQEATAYQAARRQEVEAASRRAELLFDLSSLACVVVGEDGVIVQANTAAARALNTSLRHLQHRPFQLFLAGDRDGFLSWLRGVIESGRPARWKATMRPREQRSREVSVLAAPEPGGQVAIILTGDEPTVDDGVLAARDAKTGA